MIFFTSDLHLNHENAIRHTDRPFANVDEMNAGLIRRINERVGVDDELWIIGDFSFNTTQENIRQLRRQINCRNVHLIYGNHDKRVDGTGIFQSAQDYKVLKTEYGPVVLFHYPILDWYAKHYGSIHLHGHIHSRGEYNAANLARTGDEQYAYGHTPRRDGLGYRIYDVGVDANDYRPVSLDEIAALLGVSAR